MEAPAHSRVRVFPLRSSSPTMSKWQRRMSFSLLEGLPEDLQLKILSSLTFEDGVCATVSRFCVVSKEFAAMCTRDEWWKSLCKWKGFDDRESKMQNGWWKTSYETEYGSVFKWKTWFHFRCKRVLTDQTIRHAVRTLKNAEGWALPHPVYGPIELWDVSSVTDMILCSTARRRSTSPLASGTCRASRTCLLCSKTRTRSTSPLASGTCRASSSCIICS